MRAVDPPNPAPTLASMCIQDSVLGERVRVGVNVRVRVRVRVRIQFWGDVLGLVLVSKVFYNKHRVRI